MNKARVGEPARRLIKLTTKKFGRLFRSGFGRESLTLSLDYQYTFCILIIGATERISIYGFLLVCYRK